MWETREPSLAALNTLEWRVVYNSPILIEAFFARPWRSARHSAWSSSDQIGGTEATRDPRRPKGLVMVTQGHGEHPAAASRRKTLGKKYRTKKPLLARLRPLETPYMAVVSYVSPGSKLRQAKRRGPLYERNEPSFLGAQLLGG